MKRAKKVKINYREKKVINTISEYTCSHCKSKVIGANIGKHITRFKCHYCDEELIVI